MSYILDALRKADSERERGTVPTLHSHAEHDKQHHGGTKPLALGSAWPAGAHWALAGLALVLLLLGGFLAARWLMGEPTVEPTPTPVAATLPSAVQVQPPLTPTLLAPPPAAAEPVPVPAPAPVAAATPAAIPKFTELPEAIRKALPALATSGAMYSDTPANRMLIVNGQLLREGEQIAPELLLERIELKSAVLVFKGQRFRISY